MNYQQSEEILKRIRGSKKIVISCHVDPDLDTLGSALALSEAIEQLGGTAAVVCGDPIPKRSGFLRGVEKIKQVEIGGAVFSDFDLYIAVDSSSWSMVAGLGEIKKPEVPTIVIDHHGTNDGWGDLNLIDADPKAASTAEVLYLVFEDWGVKVTGGMATNLMAGIIGDTGCFQYSNANARTFEIAGELVERGAQKQMIVKSVFQSKSFEEYKYLAEVLKNMVFDRESEMVWSAVDNKTYQRLWHENVEGIAGQYFQQVEGSKVGVYMAEEEPGLLAVSLRSRDERIDVSGLAKQMGGGGHPRAAGAKINGQPFEEAVETALRMTKKYVKENKG